MSEMSGAPWWRYVSYWASVLLIVSGMLFINTAAAEAKLGRSVHIAQHFVDEEGMNLKEGQAPAPIGKSTSDQDLEIEMGDLKILGDDGSPLPVSDFSSP